MWSIISFRTREDKLKGRLVCTAKFYLDLNRRFLDFIRRYLPATRPYFYDPRPLVLTRADAVVSWSAKSASAQLVAWYLIVEGLSDEAFADHYWPHQYRERTLYLKPDFRDALARLRRSRGRGWSLIRVMRSPLNRLVSSYRHALLFGYADKEMSRVLGRKISSSKGFSIATFLEFLEKIDIWTCDLHYRAQVNRIDALPFDNVFIINVNQTDLFEELNKVESRLGLRRTEFDKIRYFADIGKKHHSRQSTGDDFDNLFTRIFSHSDAEKEWPGKQLRAVPEVQSAVAKIYAEDYNFLNAGQD